MTHLTHPTAASYELVASQALATAEAILGEGLRNDPAKAIAAVLMGLKIYSIKSSGGSLELLNDAMNEYHRLQAEVEVEASTG
ncbi:hypothetical protein [Singulisphaera sp. PoT]|uniref:hypothetical protein n=1 Tax=Singulisphaera sp. PoT TaxID=3411797 RepID=UPI003BF4E137